MLTDSPRFLLLSPLAVLSCAQGKMPTMAQLLAVLSKHLAGLPSAAAGVTAVVSAAAATDAAASAATGSKAPARA
jgi:hypothetical protein